VKKREVLEEEKKEMEKMQSDLSEREYKLS